MSRNLLLRRLIAADPRLLASCLIPLTLPGGAIIHAADEHSHRFWFPEDCLVTLRAGTRTGRQVEIATIGYEGVLGWSALLGCTPDCYDAVVDGRGGTISAIAREALLNAAEHDASIKSALLGFVHSITAQMAGTISSSISHPLKHRVARWLLLRHDRTSGDHIFARHDAIAESLGARRASITDCLHVLEGSRLIRARRGQIVVRDRLGLEQSAGGTYVPDEAGRHKFVVGPPLKLKAPFADRGDSSVELVHC